MGCRLALLFLSVMAWAPGLEALGSEVSWEAFGRDQGLSNSSVTGIVQDETGFLWFSTQSGLDRWDGYSMRVWQKEPFSKNTLSHNLIQTMALDHGHTLWLGTYGGLDRFDIPSETFQSFVHREGVADSLSHNVVTRIYRDTLGTLWVGTLDGLNKMDEKNGTFRVYPFDGGTSGGLSGKTVRSFVEDSQGRLWVGSSGGLDLYDPSADRLVPMAKVFPGKAPIGGAVMGALRLPDDTDLWLAVWGLGLVRFNPATGDYRTFVLSDERLFSLTQGEPGELHIGTWGGGLIVFHPQTGESLTFRHDSSRTDSLVHDVIYGTFQDRGGLWWVATNGGGVSRYNPRQQQFQFLPMAGKVQAMTESKDGSLWAGVYNGGVVRIDPQGKQTVWRNDPKNSGSLSNDIINGITEDPGGQIWISTNLGVDRLDPRSGRLTTLPMSGPSPEVLPDEVVDGVLVDTKGDFWFATYRSGVVRRSGTGPARVETHYAADAKNPHSLPNNLVYFLKEDREGRIWVGTNGGLALYRPQTNDFQIWSYHANDPASLPSDTVRCLFEDSLGRIWVATNGGGLSKLDPKTGSLENYGLKEGLTSLSIYSVLEDDSRQLWISSANGLFSFRPESQTFRHFGMADGLASSEFSTGAVKRFDGRLAFGGINGVLLVNPAHLSLADVPPSVAMTQIQVLGTPRPSTTNVTLGWQENSVTFSFAALDFRNPEKNLYAYRLEGFDRDWVQAGTRHVATYTNLWPGTYHFRYKGSNPAEVWAESPQTVTLEVEASPWASWYALMAYLGLFILLVYLIQKARVSHSLGQKVSELEVLKFQLEEANGRLDQLSRLDGLTGIPNRRALDLWLAEEWARALRQQQSMAVLMLDIDDFKLYNDFYGHLVGDNCLKMVAQALVANLHRTTDLCARYGGEEFVVILHDTDLEGGGFVAERLLEAIDAEAIPHQTASAVEHVTISIGVASAVPSAEVSTAELMQKADLALYRAKTLGRHRIEKES